MAEKARFPIGEAKDVGIPAEPVNEGHGADFSTPDKEGVIAVVRHRGAYSMTGLPMPRFTMTSAS